MTDKYQWKVGMKVTLHHIHHNALVFGQVKKLTKNHVIVSFEKWEQKFSRHWGSDVGSSMPVQFIEPTTEEDKARAYRQKLVSCVTSHHWLEESNDVLERIYEILKEAGK